MDAPQPHAASPRPALLRPRRLSAPAVLVGLGMVASAVSLLDPLRTGARILGPALALAGLVLARRRGGVRCGLLFSSLLAGAFALGAWTGPEFRADSPSYYAYLRSVAFDHDLDFANEWQEWGLPERPLTPTGLRKSVHSVGPAVLWSPVYVAAHVYVLVDDTLLGGQHSRDGHSAPYRRAAAVGTLVVALAGAWLLGTMLARSTAPGVAALAVAGTVAASPVLYYLFVVPWMAHGVTFGVAAALLWAWDRARRAPSPGTWVVLGALFGLLVLTRWQGAVYLLLVAPLAAGGLLRKTVRVGWLAAAAAAAIAAFVPQMIAWKILWGSFLTLPQGGGFMDWSSPHLLDTLVSADHGLFSWTPIMLVAAIGLVLGCRRDPLLHSGALLVFAASAWTNGGVSDWAGGDAFGARRFDLAVPLLAIGMAVAIERIALLASRAPLFLPAGLLLVAGLWNVGLIALFREGRYPQAAPLERVAGDQARNLRLLAQRGLGAVAGAWGRALAYKYFVGEYVYSNYNKGGVISLASCPESDLAGSWSPPHRKPGEPAYRWALDPEACVRIPLEAPAELTVAIAARAPKDTQPQVMTVLLNQSVVASAALGGEWSDVRVGLPAAQMVPGENFLCLRFANALPGDKGSRVSAAVATIQLP